MNLLLLPRIRNHSTVLLLAASSLIFLFLFTPDTALGDSDDSVTAFTYIISLLPQLITIVAALAAGFKFLQSHNEKRVAEMEGSILAKLDVEKQFVAKDIKEIYGGIHSIDTQYKIVTGYIKDNLDRHDRMLERLDRK